jgi:hypothetical protein
LPLSPNSMFVVIVDSIYRDIHVKAAITVYREEGTAVLRWVVESVCMAIYFRIFKKSSSGLFSLALVRCSYRRVHPLGHQRQTRQVAPFTCDVCFRWPGVWGGPSLANCRRLAESGNLPSVPTAVNLFRIEGKNGKAEKGTTHHRSPAGHHPG